LATGGFEVGHRTDRSLVGEGIDFDGRRNGLALVTERFGALSQCAKALHPLKYDFSWFASPLFQHQPEFKLSPLTGGVRSVYTTTTV